MSLERQNIFAHEAVGSAEELIQVLLQTPRFRLERIVSNGSCTPQGYWYDQEDNEWIVLLKGKARLCFDDEAGDLELLPGDCLEISAHRRHRVEWTSPDEQTVWIVVHYQP